MRNKKIVLVSFLAMLLYGSSCLAMLRMVARDLSGQAGRLAPLVVQRTKTSWEKLCSEIEESCDLCDANKEYLLRVVDLEGKGASRRMMTVVTGITALVCIFEPSSLALGAGLIVSSIFPALVYINQAEQNILSERKRLQELEAALGIAEDFAAASCEEESVDEEKEEEL